MKILLLGKYGEGDIVLGPERVARELYNQFIQNKIDVTFVEYFFNDNKHYSLFEKIFGKKIISQNHLRLGIIRIVSLIINKKINIIHLINIQRFQIVILLLKNLLGIKIVSTFHGLTKIELKSREKTFKNRLFLDKWVESLAIRKSDILTFPSKLLLKKFRDYYKISSDNSIIIPNGISSKFNNIKNEIDFSKEFDLVFYNGSNPSINRGLKKIIEQLSLLKLIKVNLFIIGYSDIHYESRNNLNIVNVGFLSHDLLVEFCKGKHFIIKSDSFDSFSIMVLECMTIGVIPIITRNVGIMDYVENGINGFIYDCGSMEGLLNLFRDISNGKYDLNEISDRAKKISESLNWNKIALKYYQVFKGLLN